MEADMNKRFNQYEFYIVLMGIIVLTILLSEGILKLFI